MAKQRWKLTDVQWQKIEPLLPKLKTSKHGGRPAKTISKSFDLLETTTRLGGTRYLA